MECYTFHKLGLEITKTELNNLDIYNGSKITGFVKEQILKLIKNKDYLNAFLFFLIEHRHLIKDDFGFKSEYEYKQHIEFDPPITIKGEEVKSYGEMEIANFLFSNNINYEYEKSYIHNTETQEYRQYHPDFYLPDYNIYIEYFGIDRNGNVPSYYISRHGKSPKEEYNEGIKWKKQIHKINNTKLIDVYYYENKEGILKKSLGKQLIENGVKLNPMTNDSIFKYIENHNKGLIQNVATSFGTIINLIKSDNYAISDLRNKVEHEEYRDNMMVTLDLIEPIVDKYDEYLSENRMIDFNDMINIATSVCSSGLYSNKYKYVIVDEFQDISNSRYKLLKALRNLSDYKLYCVGDDFQSIYRFSGSDIGIFTNFEKYFGSVQINKIEKAHRFSDKLSDISGKFIMQNPNQIKKNLKGFESNRFPLVEIESYTSKTSLKFLEEKLDYLEENSSVLFLGRYNNDLDLIKENSNFKLMYIKDKEIYKIIYKKRTDLKIEFMTIHKSKGLEKDYVVLLNTRRKGMSFPSRIMDLPITYLLLDNSDNYPYSVERRLFYVAITRARKKTFLLVEQDNKSPFIKELEYDYAIEFEREKYSCPKCGEKLFYNDNLDNRYWICNNYPNCNYMKEL